MTDDPRTISAADRAQTTANLRLAEQFVQDVVAHPERYEDVPDQGTLVLLPTDDAELLEANLAMVKQLAGHGRHPVMVMVETTEPTATEGARQTA